MLIKVLYVFHLFTVKFFQIINIPLSKPRVSRDLTIKINLIFLLRIKVLPSISSGVHMTHVNSL
jgi:hypothetical protein